VKSGGPKEVSGSSRSGRTLTAFLGAFDGGLFAFVPCRKRRPGCHEDSLTFENAARGVDDFESVPISFEAMAFCRGVVLVGFTSSSLSSLSETDSCSSGIESRMRISSSRLTALIFLFVPRPAVDLTRGLTSSSSSSDPLNALDSCNQLTSPQPDPLTESASAFLLRLPFPPFGIFGLISTPSGIFCSSFTNAVVRPPTSIHSIVAGFPSG